jgi:imidazoleglycerol-phosphate dehydratase
MKHRNASLQRKTLETDIHIELTIEGTGRHEISTGIGMLDHMLTHLAVHGLFDLTVKARGDLHIDPHHTIEDLGLGLGLAFDQALAGREGITRMGAAWVPMDDSLAFVAVDLSGRPYTVIQVGWQADMVGSIPTTLVAHFFESFASTARANVHLNVPYGRDDHHKIEALFKAFGRAMDIATQIDPRRAGIVPSTKGTLA